MKQFITILVLMMGSSAFATGQTGSGGDEIPNTVGMRCLSSAPGLRYWISWGQAKDFGSQAYGDAFDQVTKTFPAKADYVDQKVTWIKDHFELIASNAAMEVRVNLGQPIPNAMGTTQTAFPAQATIKDSDGKVLVNNEALTCFTVILGNTRD